MEALSARDQSSLPEALLFMASSTRIARALLMVEPPNIDANEITDKGYLNQRAVLARRASLVKKLYSDDPEVLMIS